MERITLLLAEDHLIVREGFRILLELENDFEVVGEAKDGRQAVMLAKKLQPAVVLMDIGMPLLNGLVATRQILKALTSTKVLILSAHSEDAYGLNAMAAGASGFLSKQTSAREVCQAIRDVHNGKRFFNSALSLRHNKLNSQPSENLKAPSPGTDRLTSREIEVLQLVAEGKANKETASELAISVKTVQKHRENVMGKLNLHDTASLTRYAITTGIVESNVPLGITF